MIKFMDLSFQHNIIMEEINNVFIDVVANNQFIGGNYINEFGNEFKNIIKADYFIPCGNGTDALEIAIESLELPRYSDILVPCNSFIASSEAVTRCGHNVVFVPIDKNTHLIDLKLIDKYINKNVKAVIAVHLYGNPINIPLLKSILKNDIKIIEDCAQAHLSHYNNNYVGNMGDIAAWSFYPGKNLGALGDAGGITTNNEKLAIKSKMIANHGRVEKYNHIFEGRNSRLDNLQAGFLSVKLKYIKEWTDTRRKNANTYNKLLKNSINVEIQSVDDEAFHVYHLYVVRVKNRDKLKEYLYEHGIETGIHYPILLPNLSAYKKLNHKPSDEIIVDDVSNNLLSLPVGEHLKESDILHVVNVINNFYAN